MKKNKIIFVELDGASWNILNPLIQQGKLPNITHLINNGTSGTLLSNPPLLSPRLWVSIFTGKSSQKHGVEFFGNSSSMVRCKRIWDIFNEGGFTIGVFGSFVTWPPYPVRGFIIPSLFALGKETYPEEYQFLQELTLSERKKDKPGVSTNGRSNSLLYYAKKMKTHGVSLATLWESGYRLIIDKIKRSPKEDRYWKKAVIHLKISTEIFLYLYRKYNPDVSTIHIHLCDALAHRYWKFYESDKFHEVEPSLIPKYKDVIPKAYIEADYAIGKIIEAAGDSNIIVVSDHGSVAMDSTRIAYRLHVENFMNRLLIAEKVIPANIGLMTFLYSQDKEFIDKLHSIFKDITFLNTGEKVFDIIREESLIGLRLSQNLWGKEIDKDCQINLGNLGNCIFSDLFSPQKMEVSGTHDNEGVFIMSGPGIRKNIQIDGATIFDITPTALAVMGFPVARDMDGKVLEKAIEDNFLKNNPIRFIDTYETLSKDKTINEEITYTQIKTQLESLGYL